MIKDLKKRRHLRKGKVNQACSFYRQRLKRHIIVLESKKLQFKEDRDQLFPLGSQNRKRNYGLQWQKRILD